MSIIIESKYIIVNWANADAVSEIQEANSNIEIIESSEGHYLMEVCAYSKPFVDNDSFGQVAFRFIDDSFQFTPTMEQKPLRKITDPNTGREWWIEDGGWMKDIKKTKSDFLNHAGDTVIYFGNIKCHIEIRTINFTRDQLESFFKDFCNSLWQLIAGDSEVGANIKPIGLMSDPFIEAVEHYILYLHKIIKNPKKNLKEIQVYKNINQLRPVNKTFYEVAAHGYKHKLTGKSAEESVNTVDNKYIHYTLMRVISIIERIIESGQNSKGYAEKSLEYSRIRMEALNKDVVTINQSLLLREIKKREPALEQCKASIIVGNKAKDFKFKFLFNDGNGKARIKLAEPVEGMSIYTLQDGLQGEIIGKFSQGQEYLISATFNKSSSIFSNISKIIDLNDNKCIWEKKNECVDQKVSFKLKRRRTKYEYFDNNRWPADVKINGKPLDRGNGEYCVVELDTSIKAENGYEFKAKNFIQMIKQDRKKKYYCAVTVTDIYECKDPELEKLLKDKGRPERKLEGAEKVDRQREKERLKESIEKEEKLLSDKKKQFENLANNLNNLKKISLWFKEAAIGSSYVFPGTMTFTQNPHYYGAYSCYNSMQEISGIDEDTDNSFSILEKNGLLDMPKIYERWCLLQIINIILFFGYKPKKSWHKELIRQLSVSDYNIQIHFTSGNSSKLILWYEKELENGRRPDFVIDYTPTIDMNQNSNVESTDEQRTYRLVMDAKFHEKICIRTQIDELYHNKKYSENNENYVYILHPDPESIPEGCTISPNIWGSQAFYGEGKMFDFDWEEGYPDHKYGAIFLSPLNSSGYLDNLRRLLGMFLQYPLYKEYGKRIVEKKGSYICISCGSKNYSKVPSSDSQSDMISCKDCRHTVWINHCCNYDCKTPLIKNGYYWTYHQFKILEPYNIVCPNCGTFL